jgi:uncharacterized protein (DUF2267 family)
MSDTGYAAFSTTVDKTNQVLNEIQLLYGWDSSHRELAYHALRSVLHALRDRLTVNEANDLAAQLPMLIRGLYYEGWSPGSVPIRMTREAFLQRIAQEFTYDLEGSYEDLVQNELFT